MVVCDTLYSSTGSAVQSVKSHFINTNLINVDLPEPEPPTMATFLPAGTCFKILLIPLAYIMYQVLKLKYSKMMKLMPQ